MIALLIQCTAVLSPLELLLQGIKSQSFVSLPFLSLLGQPLKTQVVFLRSSICGGPFCSLGKLSLGLEVWPVSCMPRRP